MENQNGKLVSEFKFYSEEMEADVDVILVKYTKYYKAIIKIEELSFKYSMKFKNIEELVTQFLELNFRHSGVFVKLAKIFESEGILSEEGEL